jgi:hypothetical protein
VGAAVAVAVAAAAAGEVVSVRSPDLDLSSGRRATYARAVSRLDSVSDREHHAASPAHRHVDRPPEAEDVRQLASVVGNRGFATIAAGRGAGILADATAHPAVEAAIARSQGGGSTLDETVRERFAPRLGDDLRDVRVHTDAGADALAEAVSARAFVTGRDVFFATGEYRPGTPHGDQLLAHELTHVVQQRGAPTAGPLAVSQPGDVLEREADMTADALLR